MKREAQGEIPVQGATAVDYSLYATNHGLPAILLILYVIPCCPLLHYQPIIIIMPI